MSQSSPHSPGENLGNQNTGRSSSFSAFLDDTEPGVWHADILPGFERLSIPLGTDDEGTVSATVVRRRREDNPEHQLNTVPILYLHGWADYFYNVQLAEQMESAGYRFYALDLRKYGRSMREWQTPGFIEHLETYDDEIGAALQIITTDFPGRLPIVGGHSTGGLVISLWVHRHSGRVAAVFLNSPWLEMQGASWVRTLASAVVDPMSRINPKSPMILPKINHYWRTLSLQADGEWDLHPSWRPEFSFSIPRGWLAAVMQGHRQVAGGLQIDAPIYTVTSAQSIFSPTYSSVMAQADIVTDVKVTARRALNLGGHVTVVRQHQALHDVFASARPIRTKALEDLLQWLTYARRTSSRTS